MVWWHTSLSPALRRQRQVVSSVSSRPGSTLKACLKNISKTNKTTNWKFCQLPAKNRILTWILGYNNTSKGVWRGGDYMQEEWKSSVQAQELGGESHAIQGPDLLITRSQILFLVHSKGYIYIYIRWKKKLGIIELEMFIYISPLFIMPLWILSSPSTEVQETWCKPVLLAPLHQSKCHTAVIPDFPAIAQTHQEGWLVAWSLAAFYAWNTRIESWGSNIYYASVCTTVLVNSSQKDETASVPIHERICTQVVYIYNFKDILLSKIS